MEKIRLLVVDDNKALVGLIKEYFNNNNDICVSFEAYDGVEAMDVINNHYRDFDLILLDIIMPKKDGICVLETMKEKGIDKRVIVQTSYDSCDMIKTSAALGSSYFISKPYELSDLEKRIKQVFTRNEKNVDIDFFDNNKEIAITKLLHELGIPSHIKGYQYIREGINIIMDHPEIVGGITKELYPELAIRFNTTCSRVERAMRHAIEVGWSRSNWKLTEDIFGQSVDFDRTKPTNSEFLVTLADKMRLQFHKISS